MLVPLLSSYLTTSVLLAIIPHRAPTGFFKSNDDRMYIRDSAHESALLLRLTLIPQIVHYQQLVARHVGVCVPGAGCR